MLDQFRVVREVGRGGMGVVYEAEDTLLRRRVAIKMMPLSSQANSSHLLREARAAGQLDHPNVLRVHHVGHCLGRYYLVLELIHGGSLQDRLAAGPLPWSDATLAIAQACRGLAVAHAAGLIHHDIKPDNLMCGDNDVKVADFGLVRGVDLSRTANGLLAGTPFYMSPEKCRAEKADERSDVYALGATYFHLLAGRPPFEGPAPAQVMFAHCTAPVPDIQSLVPEVPDRCATIIQKAMSKNAVDRYQTADEMLAALNAAVASSDAALTVRDMPTVRALPAASVAGTRRLNPSRRVSAAVGGAVTVLLVATGIGAWLARNADNAGADRREKVTDNRGSEALEPVLAREGRAVELGGKVFAVAFSADGALVAAGVTGSAKGVTLWDLDRDKTLRFLNWGDVRDLTFSRRRENYCLFGASGTGPWIWFSDTDTDRYAIDGWAEDWGGVNAVAWKEDWAWAMAKGGGIQVYQHANGRLWWFGDENQGPTVLRLAFCPDKDNHNLAAASADGRIRVWDTVTGQQLPVVPVGSQEVAPVLAFAPQGQVLAAADGDWVRLWQLDKHEYAGNGLRLPFEASLGEVPRINALAFSPSGELLAAGDSRGDVTVWNYPSRALVHTFHCQGQAVLSVAIHPNDQVLAAGDNGGKLHVWDLRTAVQQHDP